MNLSYWEIKQWLKEIDFAVVGSGIVGLTCAVQLRNRFPESKILVLEKGLLPQGASSKNAGFACFGSLSEILDDLKNHSEREVLELIIKRKNGLKLLRQTLGDRKIDYQNLGGYELFLDSDNELYDNCIEKVRDVNTLLEPIFNDEVFSLEKNAFGFKNIKQQYSFNKFEGQIDTGKMMVALLDHAQQKNIKILNNCRVNTFEDHLQGVTVQTEHFQLETKHLVIATNGFASQLIDVSVKPARAQVLITKPIRNLAIKGTFHLDQGYYYFRNVNHRILFGGGRNLDFKGETTSDFGETEMIQDKLEFLLKTVILPNTTFEIDHRWSGIMGVGQQKKALVKPLSSNVYCGVRLGGMGIAIGSQIGKELAELIP